MDLDVFLVPYDTARRGWHSGAGPEALMGAGLVAYLEARAHRVIATHVIEDDPHEPPAEIRTAFELMRRLAARIKGARDAGHFPVILSGNCGVAAIGALSGLAPTPRSILWFDAHGEANTPRDHRQRLSGSDGPGNRLGGCYPGDEDRARTLFRDVDQAKAREDFIAAAGFLRGRPECTGTIGAVGFRYGGGMVHFLATRLGSDLKAGGAFYGSAPSLDDVPRIAAPLLIQSAEVDERINASWPAYEEALKAAGVTYERHLYPGTQHGFNNNTTPRYDAAAATLAWERTTTFLNANSAAGVRSSAPGRPRRRRQRQHHDRGGTDDQPGVSAGRWQLGSVKK